MHVLKANLGMVRARERAFDTVLQKFNNPETEQIMQEEESRAKVTFSLQN